MKKLLSIISIFFPLLFFAQPPKLVVPMGHTSEIYFAEFSKNGKYVLTTSHDNPAIIWDAKFGKQLYEGSNLNTKTNLSYFSPDGKYMATTSTDSMLCLWETISRKQVWAKKNTKPIINIQFSPDGKYIGVVSQYAPLFLCETSSGKLFNNYYYDSPLAIIQFSPDSKRVYASYADGVIVGFNVKTSIPEIKLNSSESNISKPFLSPNSEYIVTVETGYPTKIWNSKEGRLLYEVPQYNSISFSPDSKYFLASPNNSVYPNPVVFELSTGKIINILSGFRDYSIQAIFSPDGNCIATSSADHSVKLWDPKSGKILFNINENAGENNLLTFSADSRFLLTASSNGSANIWEVSTGNLITTLGGHSVYVYDCVINSRANLFASTSGSDIKIWNLKTGLLIRTLKGHSGEIYKLFFHPDGDHILSASSDNTIRSWEARSGVQINLLHGTVSSFLNNNVQLSSDGEWVIYINDNQDVEISDFFTGKKKQTFKMGKKIVYSCELSPDKNILLTTTSDSIVRVWNVNSAKEIANISSGHSQSKARFNVQANNIIIESLADPKLSVWRFSTNSLRIPLEGHSWFINSIRVSNSGNYIVTSSNDYSAIIWDSRSLEIIKKFKHENFLVHDAFMTADEKYLISYSSDEMTRLWDVAGEQLLSKFPGRILDIDSSSQQFVLGNNTITIYSKSNFNELFQGLYKSVAIDSNDYFTQIPNGYYQTTQSAARLLHYVTKDLKVISFEQLDVKYNRPDMVLEAIGNTDTALIKSYRKAWEKRIRKLGIDTTAFRDGYSVPETDFVSRDNIKYEQATGTLKLHINGIDSSYKLDRFNFWVNEVPVFGQRGISILKKNSNSLDTNIIIKLSQGKNQIETSISNVNGTESYRMPLLVNYTPAVKQKEQTYFIGIGIDQFKDSKYNLKFSTKDIRDLSKKLKEKYKDIIIDTLFNENVTVSNVKALKQKLLQTSVNDKVIISYSGHGMLSKDFDYYLSTYAVNFDKPEENGLPYDELESLLDSIPARKKLMLIDACHSGEVDKEDLVAMNATNNKLIKGLKPVAYKKEGQLGLKNSFELMQSLFVNVGKSTGATIISAAAGTEFALEGIDNLPNGVFTYCILEAMNKYPTMKISELKKTVGERVVEITKGLQKPTSRNETIAVDWKVW
ncbi:MAG: caspase family protein [Ferruginibacter sp.]